MCVWNDKMYLKIICDFTRKHKNWNTKNELAINRNRKRHNEKSKKLMYFLLLASIRHFEWTATNLSFYFYERFFLYFLHITCDWTMTRSKDKQDFDIKIQLQTVFVVVVVFSIYSFVCVAVALRSILVILFEKCNKIGCARHIINSIYNWMKLS